MKINDHFLSFGEKGHLLKLFIREFFDKISKLQLANKIYYIYKEFYSNISDFCLLRFV